MLCNSWVVIDKTTKLAVFEFYNPKLITRVNTDKYYVLPTIDYLGSINTPERRDALNTKK